MTKLDWRTVEVAAGVLREPTPDESRIILWLPGKTESGYQHWERLTNVPGAEIAEEQGVCFTPATSLPARQKVRGLVGKLIDWLQKPASAGTWLLPTGGFAEQAGERQTGLLLAWEAEPTDAHGDARLSERWLEGRSASKLGKNLFLVNPAREDASFSEARPALLGNSQAQAEQLLAAARQAGDPRTEAAALIDLGIALTHSGESQRGRVVLEEALAAARRCGDRSLENDALANLGMALLTVGQAGRALELLGQALASARENGDRFEEKITLGNLALVLANTRSFGEALVATDHAIKIARELGDRAHEADLLWFQAIQHAELGRQEEAADLAQAAIDVHATMRSPHIAWLASQLKKFRPPRPRTPPTTAPGKSPTGYYTGPTAAAAPPQAPVTSAAPCDPGLLRAARSAVKALESSATSGMKKVTEATFHRRLEVCAACPHHTGMRCKPCGKFTSTKAWLPHEKCPVGKWDG